MAGKIQSQAQQRRDLAGMNAWERHCKLMSDYQTYYGGKLPEQPRTLKTDYDYLVEQHRWKAYHILQK